LQKNEIDVITKPLGHQKGSQWTSRRGLGTSIVLLSERWGDTVWLEGIQNTLSVHPNPNNSLAKRFQDILVKAFHLDNLQITRKKKQCGFLVFGPAFLVKKPPPQKQYSVQNNAPVLEVPVLAAKKIIKTKTNL